MSSEQVQLLTIARWSSFGRKPTAMLDGRRTRESANEPG